MNRKLGELVGAVQEKIAVAVQFRHDPITVASGVGDELQPLINRWAMLSVEVELRLAGYASYAEFLAEVEDRTCEHWVAYQTWLGNLDDISGGFFARDAYEPRLFDSLAQDTMRYCAWCDSTGHWETDCEVRPLAESHGTVKRMYRPTSDGRLREDER